MRRDVRRGTGGVLARRAGQLRAGRANWTPMRRNVTDQDVAETMSALITSHLFVTVETIVIDGGYAATT